MKQSRNLKWKGCPGYEGFSDGTSGKEPACQFRTCERHAFDPWVGKIPWRGAWQPTPVFLPGDLMDIGAWRATVHSVAQSDTTEATYHTCMQTPSSLKPGLGDQIRLVPAAPKPPINQACDSWGRKKSDMTERLHSLTHSLIYIYNIYT